MSFPAPTERQARLMWIALSLLATSVIVFLTGIILWGLGLLIDKLAAILMPMALSVILAYILEPVVQFFERRKISRILSVVMVFVLAVMILVVSAGLVLPGLVRQSRNMASELPRNLIKLHAKAEHFFETSPWLTKISQQFFNSSSTNSESPQIRPSTNIIDKSADTSPGTNQLQSDVTLSNSLAGTNAVAVAQTVPAVAVPIPMLDSFQDYLIRLARWLVEQFGKVTTWAEFLIGFVLVPVYLFYFLRDKDSIVSRWQDYLPIRNEATRREVIFILQSINDCMRVFFRGQVLVAMCVGILLAIGYTVMGVKYSILLGVVAGVVGIVPYLGTVISLALALTVAGTQFGDWYHPMLVLIIAGSVKLLEDLVISPKIVGERAGLHPLTTIVAVLVGSTLLGGFLGAMLAIPLTATLRAVMFRYVWVEKPPQANLSSKDARESHPPGHNP